MMQPFAGATPVRGYGNPRMGVWKYLSWNATASATSSTPQLTSASHPTARSDVS